MAEPECLIRPPPLRRFPGGLLGFHGGLAWPVQDPEGIAERSGTRWTFDGQALRASPGPERAPPAARRPRREALPSLPLSTARRVREGESPGMRLLRQDAPALTIPRALLRRLLPMPAIRPLPFAPPGVAGLAAVPGGAALVLGEPRENPLLALLEWRGALFGLPASDAAPDAAPGDTACIPEAALPLAPRAQPPATPAPAPTQPLLLCRVGLERFALPALEVEALLPPQSLTLTPGGDAVRGVVSHRGRVLPVLDGGEALSLPPVLAQGECPMLRLMGPVAVAVSAVEGLRAVPLADITPNTAGLDHPLLGSAVLEDAVIPILSPAWLARGA